MLLDVVNGSVEYDVLKQGPGAVDVKNLTVPFDQQCPQAAPYGLLRCTGHQHIGVCTYMPSPPPPCLNIDSQALFCFALGRNKWAAFGSPDSEPMAACNEESSSMGSQQLLRYILCQAWTA